MSLLFVRWNREEASLGSTARTQAERGAGQERGRKTARSCNCPSLSHLKTCDSEERGNEAGQRSRNEEEGGASMRIKSWKRWTENPPVDFWHEQECLVANH